MQNIQTINTFCSRISENVLQPHVISIFRKCLYVFLLLNTLVLLPIASQIWGPDAYTIAYYQPNHWIVKVFYLLQEASVGKYYMLFIAGQIITIVLSFLLKNYQRLFSILIYFFTINLYNKSGLLQNSGSNLVVIILFYLIFMNEKAGEGQEKTSRWKIADITFTNLAFVAARIQVVFLYLVAGIYKLKGEHWLDGTALYYVFSIPEFSHPIIFNRITGSSFLVVLGTYLTLVFQLAFPILVWFRKTKNTMFVLGTFFHLGIAFLLGIPDFGFAMIIMYLLFYYDEQAKRITDNFKIFRT